MNFPIQACTTCGEQTENLYCPNCRRKVSRDEIKVFWNPGAWAQYRATVLDFQSFSSSLPYLETRVLDSESPQPAAPPRKFGVMLGIAAIALAAGVGLALWFTRTQPVQPTEVAQQPLPQGTAMPRPNPGRPGEFRIHRPTPKAGETPGVPGAAPVATLPPGLEEVCGTIGTPQEVDRQAIEEACGVTAPPVPRKPVPGDDVSGSGPSEEMDPRDREDLEESCSNSPH